MDLKKFLEHGSEHFLPNLSIDLTIIGYKDNELKCLLLQVGDKWILPGGYIEKEESVDNATYRIMEQRTGLKDPYLRFMSVIGNGDRGFSEELKVAFASIGLSWDKDYWVNSRFVTLTYYSLVDINKTHPIASGFDQAVDWFSISDLPEMWLDHKSIVLKSREKLKKDVKTELVSHNLLPEPFTMPQLHQLHQNILEEEVDRSRFQKKMLSSGLFERLPKLQKETPGRNPYLYRIKETN